MREATISLISKKDKNPLHCSSYCPISLLNTDVKLLAKLLAQCLEEALPSIISADQTGFMIDRYSFLISFIIPLHPTLQRFYHLLMLNIFLIEWSGITIFTQNLASVQNLCPGLKLCIPLRWQQYVPTVHSLPTLNCKGAPVKAAECLRSYLQLP